MDEHQKFMLFARQHGGPQTESEKQTQNKTLSVPVVFRNRLKFNECLKLRETIPRPRKLSGRDQIDVDPALEN
jgi:hypothetical protein